MIMPQSKWINFRRGLRLKCPKCGMGRLFQRYLIPVTHCSHCHFKWEDIRADLAPSWAAMTLAAHIIAVIYHFIIFPTGWPQMMQITIAIILAIMLCLALLPPMKGLFMSIIWLYRADDS